MFFIPFSNGVWSLLTLYFLLSIVQNIYCQTGNFRSITYSIDDGLPSSEVYSAFQDKNGLMWFGTSGGVSIFNGYEFKNYTTFNGLEDNVVFDFHEDFNGRVWYRSFTGGLGFIENYKVRPYPFNQALKKSVKGSYISSFEVDSSNTISFTVYPYGVGKIDERGKVDFKTHTRDSICQLSFEYEDDKPKLITFLSPKSPLFSQLEIFNRTSEQLIKTIDSTGLIAPGQLGRLNHYVYFSYVIADKTYLALVKDTSFISVQVSAPIGWIYQDRKERLWVCPHQQGVLIYESLNHFLNGALPVLRLFENKNTGGIFEDRYGGIWIAFQDKDLVFIPNNQIINYSVDSGIQNNRIVSLTIDAQEDIYYATSNGKVFRIDSLNNHVLEFEEKLSLTQIESMQSGKLLIGLSRTEPYNEMCEKYQNNHYVFAAGRSVYADLDNNVYAVSGFNIIKLMDGKNVFTYDSQSAHSFFYTIFQDSKKRLWLGGKRGLSILQNKRIINFNCFPIHFEHQTVKAIWQLDNNTLLVAIDMYGLFFINTEHYEPSVSHFIPFYGEHISHIYVDDEKDIWLSTENGLINLRKLESGNYTSTRIKSCNGLPSNQVNATISRGRTIYIATNNGLSTFNKDELQLNSVAPELRFDKISINGSDQEVNANLNLAFDENNVAFFYTGLCYRIPGKVNYKYKLEGLDNKWYTTQSRSVQYSALSSGDYEFMVKCSNENGIWSKTSKIIISIQPPFWETWWFILISVLMVLLLAFLFFKNREKVSKRKLKAFKENEQRKRKVIESELTALRAQMNPHFTFNTLNSIQSYIVNSNPELAINYIAEFSQLIRKVLENSKSPLIGLREELELLELYVKLENMRFSNEIIYDVTIDKGINPDFQKIPSMVIQPLIENAIIHGLTPKTHGEKRIDLQFHLMENGVRCIVRDNGIGRKKAAQIKKERLKTSPSFGIGITKSRFKLLYEKHSNALTFLIVDLYDSDGLSIGTQVELLFINHNKNSNNQNL